MNLSNRPAPRPSTGSGRTDSWWNRKEEAGIRGGRPMLGSCAASLLRLPLGAPGLARAAKRVLYGYGYVPLAQPGDVLTIFSQYFQHALNSLANIDLELI